MYKIYVMLAEKVGSYPYKAEGIHIIAWIYSSTQERMNFRCINSDLVSNAFKAQSINPQSI